MQLRSGDLAAPAARCLPLLPSGSGGVHRATMRETRSSTPHEPSGAQVIGGLGRPKLLVSLFTSPGGPQPGRHAPMGGGEAGIRTRGGVSPTHALQACSFNHSDTSPHASRRSLFSNKRPRDQLAWPSSDTPDCLAERVGFEPTWELPPNPLSRRARYDHFGTSPSSPAPSRLTRRHPFDQCDPILGMLERLHVWKLAEQPAMEDLFAVVPDRHQHGRICGLIRAGCDLVPLHLQRR